MDIIYNYTDDTIKYNDKWWRLRDDFMYYSDDYEGKRPYLKYNTKVEILQDMKKNEPDVFQKVKEYSWYAQYEKDVEVITSDDIKLYMKQLSSSLSQLATQVDTMERPSKLEEAIIQGVIDKSRDIAIDDLKQSLVTELNNFITETYGVLPKKINITNKDIEYDMSGLFHEQFDKTLKLVNLNIPVMLTGGAGTGKNYMIDQIAQALKLDMYYSSTITQEYKLTGFIDGGGKYHETQFYKAFTQGGVFMLDEIDASIPDALVILNSAIANGYFDFPIGREFAHEDFRVVSAGNTVGLGADMVYTGRNVIDGATLDRFVLVSMEYDKRIEEKLCPNEELRKFIYAIRNSVNKNKINHIVGTRTFQYAYKLLENEMDKKFIVESTIVKGLSDDDLRIIKHDIDSDLEWYQYVK